MKDELFQLLDGDLPDDATAELLHLLSVDPDKRAVFRQQMKLQGALYRNESHDGLTSREETEMLDRVGSAIGVKQGSSHADSGFRPGLAGVLLLCLMLGTGLGYMMNEWTGERPHEATTPPTVQLVEQPDMAAPPVVSFNRDSVVLALRDSIAGAYIDSISQAETKPVKVASKKVSARKRSTPPAGDDLTGRPQVLKKMKTHR
jgi:hypothetical protein